MLNRDEILEGIKKRMAAEKKVTSPQTKRTRVEEPSEPHIKRSSKKHDNGKTSHVFANSKTNNPSPISLSVKHEIEEILVGTSNKTRKSRSMKVGVSSFPGKFVPDWSVRVTDSILESPDVSEALIRGMCLEKDRQVLNNESNLVFTSGFCHELGKVMIHAGCIRERLTKQTSLAEKYKERVRSLEDHFHKQEQSFLVQLEELHKVGDELESDKQKLLSKKGELTKKNDKLLNDKARLSTELMTKDCAERQEIEKAIVAFTESFELKDLVETRSLELLDKFKKSEKNREDIIGISRGYYTNGFQDCKRQLEKKSGTNWGFLFADELNGSTSLPETKTADHVNDTKEAAHEDVSEKASPTYSINV